MSDEDDDVVALHTVKKDLHLAPKEKEEDDPILAALKLIFGKKSLAKLIWLADEHGTDLRGAANVAVSAEFRNMAPADLDVGAE